MRTKTTKAKGVEAGSKVRAAHERCSRRDGSVISDDRAMQIVNNVAEEYVDLGRTNFAAKEELCRTILWLRQDAEKERQRLQGALDAIFTRCAQALLRRDSPNEQGHQSQPGASMATTERIELNEN